MSKQIFFNYKLKEKKDILNFYTNNTNIDAFNIVTNTEFKENIFLKGPKKSGKSHLLSIWASLNNAIFYDDNFKQIMNSNNNVIIDNIFDKNEEKLFHIINNCSFKAKFI